MSTLITFLDFGKLLKARPFFWLIDTDCFVRKVEMYHASTDHEKTKEGIFSDYREKESRIRILVCTVAFGMGIDIPRH
jgi:RecG-like helicase